MDHYRKEGMSEIWYRGSHRVYESIAPLEFRVKLRKNIYNIYGYDLPSDPLSPINIDPSDIKYCTPYRFKPVKRHIGRVKDGEWDQHEKQRVEEGTTFVGLRERFVDELPWEETIYYQHLEGAVSNGELLKGCENKKDIKTRCEYLDNLYNHMKSHGYSAHRNLTPPERIKRSHHDTTPEEITVNIDRNGNPLLQDGHHRLSLAKILDIDSIPVISIVYHKQSVK